MGTGKVVGGKAAISSSQGVRLQRKGSNTKIMPVDGGLDDLEDMNFDSK